jgi:hypothetical protein
MAFGLMQQRGMRDWLVELLLIKHPPPMAFFLDFLSGLPEDRRFCIPCLARLYSVAEEELRREMPALAGHIERSPTGRCWTCEQTGPAYRLRRSYPAAA